ncbi:hypothetical protein ACLIA0_03755 [Bacillaceae bacterium W0354]
MHTYSKDHMYNLCEKHLKQYVLIETNHGEKIEGVIIDLDGDNVHLVTPAYPVMGQHMERQFGPFGYGYGYGYPYGGYGYGYPGRYGLRRLILPLTAIAALSLLPW